MNKIEEAKATLREAGYYVDNLWHIADVKSKLNVTDDEEAQAILNSALTNDWIMTESDQSIAYACHNTTFKKLAKDDD